MGSTVATVAEVLQLDFPAIQQESCTVATVAAVAGTIRVQGTGPPVRQVFHRSVLRQRPPLVTVITLHPR